MNYMNNYPTYGNYGYNPRNYSQPMAQPTMQQPVQSIGTDFPLRFANIEEAKAFIVLPNQRQFFINNERNELYIKSADGMGQSFFDEYNIVPKGKKEEVVATINAENTADFVHKDDIKDFVSRDYVSALESQISALNSKVEKVLRLGELVTPNTPKKQQEANK